MENETESPKGFFENLNKITSSGAESFFASYRYPLIAVFLGLILIGLGAFYIRSGGNGNETKVEVLSGTTEAQNAEFAVEVAGAVEKPGVYILGSQSRVDDALTLAGGLSVDADREWVEKALNRAAKIIDGQKIFIPKIGESGTVAGATTIVDGGGGGAVSSLVNINTASLSELDKLPGIGPVYGQSIIDHRPYSMVEELVSKGALKQSTYEKLKNLVSVY